MFHVGDTTLLSVRLPALQIGVPSHYPAPAAPDRGDDMLLEQLADRVFLTAKSSEILRTLILRWIPFTSNARRD